MYILSAPENSFYAGRIRNFLRFKNIPFSETLLPEGDPKKDEIMLHFPKILENPESLPEKFRGRVTTGSVKILRDIEESSPYPIGFIGPIESTFQWSTMALTAYDSLSQEIIDSAGETIEEKVEDEYFVMGPTFSVADCVLTSDLTQVAEQFTLSPLVHQYMQRVEQQLP